ncbi:hypothetical protein BU26DRAFT_523318 [Trematosphaeria pertusa]|uniref:Uncharacterized protein n=1 Tax=Trematosphaeria pertusa TaxID=390896 RepID=A0A6A6I0C2_9PLEO|nr:uncharacterized protein BU26DRAFT_523318 [Trematosphaeria pertusa]KAF2243726.1 hypothetical protein BU26DRAFT_523318 [Trematosphaeria pertusa]
MADRYPPVPRGWNCYRPTYSPPRSTRSGQHPSLDNGDNPNKTPAAPHHHQRRPGRGDNRSDGRPDDELLKLWDAELEGLMGRTERAYDLVSTYEELSMGGKRWLPTHIEVIREAGKDLHHDIRVLQGWRRTVAKLGKVDRDMMRKIEDECNAVKQTCLRVQGMINGHEQVPVRNEQEVEVDADGQLVGFKIKGAAGGIQGKAKDAGVGRVQSRSPTPPTPARRQQGRPGNDSGRRVREGAPR